MCVHIHTHTYILCVYVYIYIYLYMLYYSWLLLITHGYITPARVGDITQHMSTFTAGENSECGDYRIKASVK